MLAAWSANSRARKTLRLAILGVPPALLDLRKNAAKDAPVKTNYVLVDFENVQPKSFAALEGHPFKILIFLGANQNRVSLELASALQPFGRDARYIQIEGNGPNALDFHIAFYIGELSQADPNTFFHVISKDAGFDPLIRHLKARKIYAQRHRDIADIPLVRLSSTKTVEEKLEAIISWLLARGTARPRAVKTLSSSINSLFMKKLDDAEVDRLVKALVARGVVSISGSRVGYEFPAA